MAPNKHARLVLIGLMLLCLCTLIGWATTLSNGRGDQLTHITNDRAGGDVALTNGHGDQATIFIPWHQGITTTNGHGEILETGAEGTHDNNGVRFWTAY